MSISINTPDTTFSGIYFPKKISRAVDIARLLKNIFHETRDYTNSTLKALSISEIEATNICFDTESPFPREPILGVEEKEASPISTEEERFLFSFIPLIRNLGRFSITFTELDQLLVYIARSFKKNGVLASLQDLFIPTLRGEVCRRTGEDFPRSFVIEKKGAEIKVIIFLNRMGMMEGSYGRWHQLDTTIDDSDRRCSHLKWGILLRSAETKTAERVVISSMTKSPSDVDESLVLQKTGNIAHIISLLAAPFFRASKQLHTLKLVMTFPYAPCRDLSQYMRAVSLSFIDMLQSITPVGEALAHLHEKNIVHRDVKPENILVLSKTEWMLSDFESAADLSVEKSLNVDTFPYTRYYAPPEMALLSSKKINVIDYKAYDTWSFGITLFYLFSGRYPDFIMRPKRSRSSEEINTAFGSLEHLKQENIQNEIERVFAFSKEFIVLLKAALTVDPTARSTMQETVVRLKNVYTNTNSAEVM